MPSGVYTIDPDGGGARAPFDAYCDMTTDGGGWTLVVHNNDTQCWMTGNVDLNPDYSYGTYSPDPVAPEAFYKNFSAFDFDEFLFAWGDYAEWAVMASQTVYPSGGNWCPSCFCPVSVTASSCNTSYPTTWTYCLRSFQPEDPWISVGDHNGGCGYRYSENILYGEGTNYCIHIAAKNAHRGANVFIRNSAVLDSDSDGIPDLEDACDHSPQGESPWPEETSPWYGCGSSERDIDGDTITDSADACPSSEAFDVPWIVENMGCAGAGSGGSGDDEDEDQDEGHGHDDEDQEAAGQSAPNVTKGELK